MQNETITQTSSSPKPAAPLHIEYIRALELLERQMLAYIEEQGREGECLNLRIFKDLFNKAKWSLR